VGTNRNPTKYGPLVLVVGTTREPIFLNAVLSMLPEGKPEVAIVAEQVVYNPEAA
jgi:hypothetical protein